MFLQLEHQTLTFLMQQLLLCVIKVLQYSLNIRRPLPLILNVRVSDRYQFRYFRDIYSDKTFQCALGSKVCMNINRLRSKYLSDL